MKAKAVFALICSNASGRKLCLVYYFDPDSNVSTTMDAYCIWYNYPWSPEDDSRVRFARVMDGISPLLVLHIPTSAELFLARGGGAPFSLKKLLLYSTFYCNL